MELKPITYANVDELMALSVREDQRSFVASNKDSLVDAYIALSTCHSALPFGIYEDGKPVGFVMFGYDTLGDEDDPEIAGGNYCLWRFMIDQRYQGNGLGRRALAHCLDYIRALPCGPAEYLWTSYEPDNLVASGLYRKIGFRENGEMCGKELVAVLRL